MSTTVGNSSYLWLPSTGEVWNNTTSYVSNSTSSYIGLWGLNSTDRAFDISNYNRTTSGSFSGIYGMVYPSFVRSGSSQINNPTASYIGADGDIGIMLASHLQNSYNVRPACHISLSRLVSLAGYTISASESGSTDQLSINRTSYTYPLYSTSTITFTYTANANYYINQVRVGSTTITDIPTSQPSSYTNAGTFEYRVYRSNNQVNIVLRSVTANVSLIGYCQPYINVSTENDAVTINSYNRTNYFSTTATITVQQNTAYTQRFRLPSRNWIDISSTSSGDGYIGDIYYNFTNENNIITVYFENLTLGSIFEVIFSGDEKPLSYTATGGTATFEEFIDDEGYTNIIVRPAEGYYVNTITVDNVAFTVEYYRAEIMGAGNARIIGYTVKDTNNVLDLWLVGQYDNSNIVFNLSTTRPTYRVPATGGAVTGTVVTAGAGGEARIVGFDSSDTADTDTLTFIAVSYSGYVFSGWEVDGQILSGYGSNASIPYSLVKDKVVTAVFTPTSNNSANGSTDNPWGSDFA